MQVQENENVFIPCADARACICIGVEVAHKWKSLHLHLRLDMLRDAEKLKNEIPLKLKKSGTKQNIATELVKFVSIGRVHLRRQ